MRANRVQYVAEAGDTGNLANPATRDRIEAVTELAVDAGNLDLAGVLIDLLDRADGDPDHEDDTEDSCGCEDRKGEPNLGAPEAQLDTNDPRYSNANQDLAWSTPTADLEKDDEGEPELGWPNPEPGEWRNADPEDADEADVIASARSAGLRRSDLWPRYKIGRDGTVRELIRGSDGLVKHARHVSPGHLPAGAAFKSQEVR